MIRKPCPASLPALAAAGPHADCAGRCQASRYGHTPACWARQPMAWRSICPPADGERQPGRLPRYVIEPIPDALPGHWIHANATMAPRLFRITAAGFGNDPAIAVVLQTVFRPRLPQP
ncbi:hypothetical protein JK151_16405 (plasmid) [Ralstonia syzygii subsp. celebesensis]|nr:hypothetical protein JK151_16405 [Ralstonia syzygii subsp. celebesensis]